MPTATLGTDQTSLTQQQLTAGTVLQITVTPRNKYETTAVEILNHGNTTIYAKAMNTVTTDDPAATLIPPQAWAILNTPNQIAITTTQDTTITITRNDTSHTRYTNNDIATNKRIDELKLGIQTISRADFTTIALTTGNSTTITVTLDRTMPDTNYTVSLPQYNGMTFTVTNKTTTTITIAMSASVLIAAGIRMTVIAYA